MRHLKFLISRPGMYDHALKMAQCLVGCAVLFGIPYRVFNFNPLVGSVSKGIMAGLQEILTIV